MATAVNMKQTKRTSSPKPTKKSAPPDNALRELKMWRANDGKSLWTPSDSSSSLGAPASANRSNITELRSHWAEHRDGIERDLASERGEIEALAGNVAPQVSAWWEKARPRFFKHVEASFKREEKKITTEVEQSESDFNEWERNLLSEYGDPLPANDSKVVEAARERIRKRKEEISYFNETARERVKEALNEWASDIDNDFQAFVKDPLSKPAVAFISHYPEKTFTQDVIQEIHRADITVFQPPNDLWYKKLPKKITKDLWSKMLAAWPAYLKKSARQLQEMQTASHWTAFRLLDILASGKGVVSDREFMGWIAQLAPSYTAWFQRETGAAPKNETFTTAWETGQAVYWLNDEVMTGIRDVNDPEVLLWRAMNFKHPLKHLLPPNPSDDDINTVAEAVGYEALARLCAFLLDHLTKDVSLEEPTASAVAASAEKPGPAAKRVELKDEGDGIGWQLYIDCKPVLQKRLWKDEGNDGRLKAYVAGEVIAAEGKSVRFTDLETEDKKHNKAIAATLAKNYPQVFEIVPHAGAIRLRAEVKVVESTNKKNRRPRATSGG